MRFLKLQLVHVRDGPHIPALVQVSHRLTCPATQRTCLPQTSSRPATRDRQLPPLTLPGCGTHHEHTLVYQRTYNLNHRYQCSAADVGQVRSVTSISPCLVQQAQLHQCSQSPHSLHYSSVGRSRHLLGLTCNVVSFCPGVWGMTTNCSVGFSHSVRGYRGQTRPTALQRNNRGNPDMDEYAENITEDTDIVSDSDNGMSYQLSTVRQDDRQAREDVLLGARLDTQETTINQDSRNKLVQRKPVDELTLAELSRTSLNIVPYVKRSLTLQNLVRLGVNLSRIQKVPGVAEYLIKADFERQVVPLLKLLALVGVEANMVGRVFTVNPLLLLESVEDLELCVGYLVHMNFGLREVASLVTKDPVVLLMDPIMLDEKLAFLQKLFNLTAHQVREVVKTYPQLLPVKNKLLTDMRFHLCEFMGFSSAEIQQLLLQCPQVFFHEKHKLVKRFDYLHNHMLISHHQLLTWPLILATSQIVFKNRHLFLLYKGRAQYDPYQENYVCLQSLSSTPEEEFCRSVAKSDLTEFYQFCKTL